MDSVEAWARAVLFSLAALPVEEQYDLVVGPLESVRNGMSTLAGILPGYADKALAATKTLAAVLTTVRCAFESGWHVGAAIEVVPMALPTYRDENDAMVKRLQYRGRFITKNQLMELETGWNATLSLLRFPGDAEIHLNHISNAKHDADALLKFLG